ncbi:Exodeoxyribonuclease VII small subunit (EC 3.1.11.6) [uncultured Gammaproteobacteria bacterium]|uniref:exodeoxyribonuclease VII small subunit n=1 Tax=Bathymodiolus heckerae thiotrophic gill symbiont TaxID=1052212 RepID=UPI0010B5A626|nr:exodeoxyribonuclease VII small subunit [Bathymodiolus heckerae thiotrophic gill symbiont]CAC9590288.1 Exodeoxyribonuclease VII small subunit (EC 3.1.11.6) [uncultured Gammaproteobacteria bacterium]CAC9592755.1 Exodeoxyribonuclease VII small subunit (EC 3.1.11.6) [uncultured Gammaproteobacteria bacterium]SHN90089.1 Exodeoxyribonuclease VII small subunit [Bathymodiolus heckerae thiotrophic gill symbiont]
MTKKFDFNKGLTELEDIVNTMESGDLSLEDSLMHFSKGVELTKSCQTALNDASQKISKLTQQDDFSNATAFEDS